MAYQDREVARLQHQQDRGSGSSASTASQANERPSPPSEGSETRRRVRPRHGSIRASQPVSVAANRSASYTPGVAVPQQLSQQQSPPGERRDPLWSYHEQLTELEQIRYNEQVFRARAASTRRSWEETRYYLDRRLDSWPAEDPNPGANAVMSLPGNDAGGQTLNGRYDLIRPSSSSHAGVATSAEAPSFAAGMTVSNVRDDDTVATAGGEDRMQ